MSCTSLTHSATASQQSRWHEASQHLQYMVHSDVWHIIVFTLTYILQTLSCWLIITMHGSCETRELRLKWVVNIDDATAQQVLLWQMQWAHPFEAILSMLLFAPFIVSIEAVFEENERKEAKWKRTAWCVGTAIFTADGPVSTARELYRSVTQY